MNKHATAFPLFDLHLCFFLFFFFFSPPPSFIAILAPRMVEESLVNEAVAPREPFEEVLVVDVIDGDVQMLVALDEGRVVVEFPVDNRHDVRDVAVRQRLRTSQGDESMVLLVSETRLDGL